MEDTYKTGIESYENSYKTGVEELDQKEILAYDIEVFKYNSMVVFKDLEGETIRVFSSSLDGLGDYIDRGLIKEEGYKDLKDFVDGKVLVGYNNYHFDDYILYAMTLDRGQKLIKEQNDAIIKNKSKVNMKKINNCITLDAFQQIDVSRPGLKKVEGNMGVSIVESSTPFDIDRPLTPKENLEALKYCEYDVSQTIEIFKMRKDYFKSKFKLVDMIEKDYLKKMAYKWNTTSLVGQILKPRRKAASRRHVSDDFMAAVPEDVQEMWRQLDGGVGIDIKKKKVVHEAFGNVIEFGWGGLHGAPKGYVERGNVRLADVALIPWCN